MSNTPCAHNPARNLVPSISTNHTLSTYIRLNRAGQIQKKLAAEGIEILPRQELSVVIRVIPLHSADYFAL